MHLRDEQFNLDKK